MYSGSHRRPLMTYVLMLKFPPWFYSIFKLFEKNKFQLILHIYSGRHVILQVMVPLCFCLVLADEAQPYVKAFGVKTATVQYVL